MKLFRDIKKYIVIMLLLLMIGLNSYNINKNTTQCNSNTQAVISLAWGVEIIANSFTNFVKTYMQDRADILFREQTEPKIIKEEKHIDSAEFEKENKWNYLKAVTVYIEGEAFRQYKSPYVELSFNFKAWCGTGIIVDVDEYYTYVLTNKHVAGDDFKNHTVNIKIDHNYERIHSEVVATHPSQDLALLEIRGNLFGKYAIKGTAYPISGEKVWSMGHHLARPFIYGEGVFSGVTVEHDIYQFPTMGGCSGSGVFNKNGELMGLLCSISGNDMSWDITHGDAVKIFCIKEFLKENGIEF